MVAARNRNKQTNKQTNKKTNSKRLSVFNMIPKSHKTDLTSLPPSPDNVFGGYLSLIVPVPCSTYWFFSHVVSLKPPSSRVILPVFKAPSHIVLRGERGAERVHAVFLFPKFTLLLPMLDCLSALLWWLVITRHCVFPCQVLQLSPWSLSPVPDGMVEHGWGDHLLSAGVSWCQMTSFVLFVCFVFVLFSFFFLLLS